MAPSGGVTAKLDTAAFTAAFKAAQPELKALAMQANRARAERIADRARSMAPVGDGNDPHAGRLVADIGIKDEGEDYIDVGTTVPEGFLQEFGTHDEPAQPFMRPAIASELGR